MSDVYDGLRLRTFSPKKVGISSFSNPSLVSPTTPTLANPVRGFGLPTNNVIQTATEESTNLQEMQAADEQSLLSEVIHQRSFGHDISRMALRRPQAKLTVGAPNDVYEQEADRVADQVMSMPDAKPSVQREVMPEEEEELQTKALGDSIQREVMPEEEEEIQTKPLTATITPLVQREGVPEEEEELQTKALGDSIQREAMPEEEEEIQTKRSPDASFQAESNLENRLSSSQGGGSPLPDEVRSFMEPRFGTDFSQVRVHTGSEAVQMNQDLNAQAFTHKQDVYFGAGKAPAKDALTAHELTHVVQQSSAVQRQPKKNPDSEEVKRVKELTANYDKAVADGKWSDAAVLLNGFNTSDILNKLKALSPQGRKDMFAQAPKWVNRVLEPLDKLLKAGNSVKDEDFERLKKQSLEEEQNRVKKLNEDYEAALKAGKWDEAAKLLNGFSDSDILAKVKKLSSDKLSELRHGASVSMPGWSSRVTDIIDSVAAKLQDHGAMAGIPQSQVPATPPTEGVEWNSAAVPPELLKGTRTLTAEEKAEVERRRTTEVQAPKGGTLPTFQKKGYEKKVENKTNQEIDWQYKQLAKGKANDRKDPNKLYKWDVIEKIAALSKREADRVFGNYAKGKPMKAGLNLFDAWEEKEKQFASGGAVYEQSGVEWRVEKIFGAELVEIDKQHGAVQSRPEEQGILDSVKNRIIAKRRSELVEIHKGWPGFANAGKVYLQRFVSSDAANNRDAMWNNFQTVVHEYIHTLEHSRHIAYRTGLGELKGGKTYREGMTDYFTKIVLESTTYDDQLRKDVEGLYHSAGVKHPIPQYSGYDEAKNAEAVVGVVGIRNAMAAFFAGRVDLIGG